MKKKYLGYLLIVALASAGFATLKSCKPKNVSSATSGDAAQKAYVAPGKFDEFYNFVSGGFSGQMSVYGIPSGRLLRVIPVFSVDPRKRLWLLRRNQAHAKHITWQCSLG
jgi:nitrous-oxide reductase